MINFVSAWFNRLHNNVSIVYVKCQWHPNSWRHIMLSYHPLSHTVGMWCAYIYIYILFYRYYLKWLPRIIKFCILIICVLMNDVEFDRAGDLVPKVQRERQIDSEWHKSFLSTWLAYITRRLASKQSTYRRCGANADLLNIHLNYLIVQRWHINQLIKVECRVYESVN